eukprot:COSAG05_NODE_359_length_10803_cov_14.909193_5_plen_133_part_00
MDRMAQPPQQGAPVEPNYRSDRGADEVSSVAHDIEVENEVPPPSGTGGDQTWLGTASNPGPDDQGHERPQHLFGDIASGQRAETLGERKYVPSGAALGVRRSYGGGVGAGGGPPHRKVRPGNAGSRRPRVLQ